MFVLSSDFDVPPFNLPDLGSNNSFEDYVDACEEEILKKLLGKTFYDQFIAGLANITEYDATAVRVIGNYYSYGNDVWEALTTTAGVTPVEGVAWTLIEEDNKWLIMKNGADYDYADETYEWQGIRKLLIPYIYYRWVKDFIYDTVTGSGVVVGAAENSTTINPGSRMSAAYNKFSKLAGGNYCIENSLYGFLYVNVADYPDYKYYPQGRVNTFDL